MDFRSLLLYRRTEQRLFRGNELLYACNIRDDGCTGYVLIRNDAPYYSAVSMICDQGIIKEISFECLGSVAGRLDLFLESCAAEAVTRGGASTLLL